MASAVVNGIQSNGVGVSAKHFFANNGETNRNSLNTIISERAIREIYLKGWQIMLKHSSPWTIMSSYNLMNGPFTSENGELLITVLRKEWGFKGFVMTDWFGGNNAVSQISAGNNLIMPGNPEQSTAIIEAVKSGKLAESVVDQNVSEMLNIIVKSPIFNGYQYSDNPPLKENAQIARAAAAESMVLLKNNAKTLPLASGSKVALFGVNQLELIAGGTGSGNVNKMYTVTLSDGLFKAGYTLNSDLYLSYSNYMANEFAKRPKLGFWEELMSPNLPIQEMEVATDLVTKAANESSVAIIAIGRNAGEAKDRKVKDDFTLSEKEIALIKSVSTAFHAQNKKVIVTLNIGGVIEVMSWRDQVDAILLAWQPGLEGGNSIADVVSGKVNPSGKLATTFPAKYEDEITAKNFPGREIPGTEKPGLFGQKMLDAEVIYEEGVYVGYRYYSSFKVPTAYPFGYGLSYTSFKTDNLTVSKPILNDKIQVSVTVTNIGNLAGKEVAELYVSAPGIKMDKPIKELKAFAKTKLLQPGESQTLSFDLTSADLASFNTASSTWITEAGDYLISFGNAEQNFASTNFKISKEIKGEKVNKVLSPKVTIKELKNKVRKIGKK
jgi:beta-glucosidase